MDRPDIDALLIGALYGELTPADEARLAAHLESHPADKSALEGMKATRENVRASRIFEAQVEPPQAVSALLLQEAARRAPRRAPDAEPRESWFHRFVRSFMAHPAMAAAAMLVLVVGVAGTLYMRNGDHFADKTAETTTIETERADNVAQAPAAPPTEQAAAAQGSSAYAVGLAEEQQGERAKDAEKAEAPKVDRKAAPTPPRTTTTATASKPDVADDGDGFAKAPAKHNSKKGYLEVTTPEPQPKELDKNDEDIAAGPRYGTATGAAGGGRAPGGAPATTGAIGGVSSANAPPPPPPPQVAAAPMDEKPVAKTTVQPPKPTAPPPSKTVAKAPAQDAPAAQPQQPPGPATDTGLFAWAKSQHAAAVAKVKAGDCGSAATLVVQVKNRMPSYYAQYMQGDRELKSCTAYINDAEMRDEATNSKQKATKRASDEPAPATKK